jgi:hypothetical protein
MNLPDEIAGSANPRLPRSIAIRTINHVVRLSVLEIKE